MKTHKPSSLNKRVNRKKTETERSLQDIEADFLRRDSCCSSWTTIKKVTCNCWSAAKIYFNHAVQREKTQIHPEDFKLISAQFLQYSSGSLGRIGLTMEMFWENLILCPGRFHTLFISCWTLLYAAEHVGIADGEIRLLQLAGCEEWPRLKHVFEHPIPLLYLQENLF